MKEGIIKDTYEKIIREFQTVVTIAYIGAVGIGMLFNYQKYSEFGINIFDYADVFDFLIAPFSDLKILIFSVASILIPYLSLKLDSWLKRKFPKSYSKMNLGWDKKDWFYVFRTISFAILFIYYLYLSSEVYGSVSKQQINNQIPIKVRFSDNEIKKGILIGKTREVLFLLQDEKVDAVPITSLVKEFEIK